MKSKWQIIVLLLVVTALAVGCSGKHKLVAGAPSWVNKGSGAFDEKGEKIFYGVGAVSGINSPSLAVQAADQRARADIARQLETYVAGLSRDFQASTTASGGQQATEEQHLEQSLKTITQVSVRGAKVLDHWKEPESNTLYSLVRLDLEAFKATIAEIKEIDPELRSFVRSHAEKAFEQLHQEEK